MPGERVFLRTNAVNTVFPQNEKLLFSNEKLNLTALSGDFRAGTGPIPMRFFLPRRMASSKYPANAFFCELTRKKPFSLKMKNRYFPLNNLS